MPSLDGLRAISIFGVLYSHLSITPNFEGAGNPAFSFFLSFFAGDKGVNIFFVLSGFLITTLLLSEESRNGSFSLKAFYARRAFRILPVYLFFLATVFILNTSSFVRDLDVRSFLPPLLFLTSSLPINTGWTLAHTWSLSVEEQFYLLWPLLLWAARRKACRNAILLGSLILFPAIRSAVYLMWHERTFEFAFYSFPYRADLITMGCLLALNADTISARLSNRTTLRFLLIASGATNYFFTQLSDRGALGFITIPLSFSAQGAFVCLLIVGYTIIPRSNSLVYLFLNLRPVAFVGVISYSLYLWQQIFLQDASTVKHEWKHYPTNILLVVLVSLISYRLCERPFLKLRRKLIR